MPSEEELAQTVLRMESALDRLQAPDVQRLLTHYRTLCERFEHDLPATRDQALARASVLMLIQAVARRSGAA